MQTDILYQSIIQETTIQTHIKLTSTSITSPFCSCGACVCAHMNTCIHVSVCLLACLPICLCIPEVTVKCLSQAFSILFWGTVSLTAPRTGWFTRPAGQWAPGILLSLFLLGWDYRHAVCSFLCEWWGAKLRSLASLPSPPSEPSTQPHLTSSSAVCALKGPLSNFQVCRLP